MSGPTTLVTGATGFVGSWLLPHALEIGWRVVATHRREPAPAASGPEWRRLDLTDRETTFSALKDVQPDYIVHLAGLAFPPEAQRRPIEALRQNYLCVDNLLGGMRRHAPQARLLLVGSGEVYGTRAERDRPACENDPLAPRSTYAATKVAAELRALLAGERDDLDVVRTRSFNHTGPGRPETYAEASFAAQIVRIERGEQAPPIRVGNLDAIRDFSDVRDVVRAYTLLAERGEAGGVYNVCSGTPRRVREVIDHLVSRSTPRPDVEIDPERFQPTVPEHCALVGDPTRLRELGWEPRYRFEETLDDVLSDWRTRL